MTDRIDIDELDVDDDATDDDGPNRGDWFWRGRGDPADEPAPEAGTEPGPDPGSATDPDVGAGTGGETGGAAGTGGATDAGDAAGDETGPGTGGDRSADPVPHVPRQNLDRPAGIPVESGGAGSGAGTDHGGDGEQGGTAAPGEDGTAGVDGEASGPPGASGPHGGGVDDMTMAFTYNAVGRLADPGRVVADARGWADWIGIVGRVSAPVLTKFQRDERVDLDFFNGSGTGPGERLADIDEHSMFYAERMVVVGVEGEDEDVAARADWEFVPLSEAAGKADWELSSPSE